MCVNQNPLDVMEIAVSREQVSVVSKVKISLPLKYVNPTRKLVLITVDYASNDGYMRGRLHLYVVA